MIREIKERHTKDLLARSGVVGVGVGLKNGTGPRSVVVLVEHKRPLWQLDAADIVPESLEGVKTDVLEVGYVQAPPPLLHLTTIQEPQSWTDRYRPAPPGVSVGHKDITAGTIGCLVEKEVFGQTERFILSNNHVLANTNAGKPGDSVMQPGPVDGGGSPDVIAQLFEYVPISFSTDEPTCPVAKAVAGLYNAVMEMMGFNHRLAPYLHAESANLVDAAIAAPVLDDYVTPEIIDGVGVPRGLGEAELGMEIHKCGRTTQHTHGTINAVHTTIRVSYGGGRVATFEDQLVAGAMSAGGDSGSAVLDLDNNVVGLLFAGSNVSTIINPISHVVDALGVRLAY